MFCEDSVNIKNSLGFIKKIHVENSFDALDLDFSKLNIENIIINGANNDCVDVSFGNYLIKKQPYQIVVIKGYLLVKNQN